jgi:hypothetical protein
MRWRELNEICDKSNKSRTTSSSEDSERGNGDDCIGVERRL